MTKKLTKILFTLIAGLVLVSCVGEKKGKSPKCGVGEEFNKVSQKCYNIRMAPTSTLESIEVYEDAAATTFQLKYTDVNNDQAVDCQVFDTEADIEIRSPLFSGAVTEAQNVINTGTQCVTSISPATNPVERAAAAALLTAAQTAFEGVQSTDDTIGMTAAIGNYAGFVTSLTNYCESLAGIPLAQYYGTLTKNLNTNLVTTGSWINKRCACSAGNCTAQIIPSKDKFGSYGISYNITEGVDGSSINKQVSVQVLPVNDLPVAVDGHFFGDESIINGATPINFTIPAGQDVESFPGTLTYSLVTNPAGTITNCALQAGYFDQTDTSCTYTPPSNDTGVANPLVNKFAARFIDGDVAGHGITYTARSGGVIGESISIIYSSHPLVHAGQRVDVSVSGKNITVLVESGVVQIQSIINAIQNNYEANALVSAVAAFPGSATTDTQTILGSAQFLTGSATPYDSFTYSVSDGIGTSVTAARMSIDVELEDDAPIGLAIAGMTVAEDTDLAVTLNYSDVEGHLGTACVVTPSANLIVKTACSCDVAGVCTATLRPTQDYFGTTEAFIWTVTANGLTSLARAQSVTVTAVNDPPFAKLLATTQVESATMTAAPFTFTFNDGLLAPAVDIEGDALTYTLEGVNGGMGAGVLTGCVTGTTLTPGATCTFTPQDGNINGDATTNGTITLVNGGGTISFTAINDGEAHNSVDVNIIIDANKSIPNTAQVEVVSTGVAAFDVNVYVDGATTTLSNIQTAISTHMYSSKLMTVTGITVGTTVASIAQTVTLAGAETSGHRIDYKVVDGNGGTAYGVFHINITPTDDSPIACPFSPFSEAPECGLAGCIGATTPTAASITPKTVGILYYDTNSAVCYKSTGISANTDWAIVTDFSNIITKKVVSQNGFVEIPHIRLDEGGADTTEDAQVMNITKVVITDETLIPRKAANILATYDGASVALTPAIPGAGVPLVSGAIDGATSADLKDFSLKIIPSDSIVGSATVTVSISDGTSEVDLTIPIEVTDSAIIHKGWSNIMAQGPKVDKYGAVQDQSFVCNYSETKCASGGSCTGAASPVGIVSADEANAIYYDSTNKKCYKSSAAGTGNWVAFNTYCNITPSYYDSAAACTSGASCISSTGLAPTTIATKLNTFLMDYTSDTNYKCYRSSGRDTASWQEYDAPGSVTLSWNSMVLTGSGSLSGFNVFRRMANETFDYTDPINKTLLTGITTTFVDNADNSKMAPVPNTVYYYEVIPVVSAGSPATNIQIRTGDFEKRVVRVLVPGANKSFVSRDIVNMTMCDKMANTAQNAGVNYAYNPTLDTYTCNYEGPGDTGTVAGAGIYDFGKDLIVDRFEAGCPYTKASDPIESCSNNTGNMATSGSCIGTVDPSGNVTMGTNANQVYYNRTNGKCFQHTGGNVWLEMNSLLWNEATNAAVGVSAAGLAALASKYSYSALPPVTNLSQSDAKVFCDGTATGGTLGLCDGPTNTGVPAVGAAGTFYYNSTSKKCFVSTGAVWEEGYSSLSGRLPSRKEQVAYSEWDKVTVPDSTANTREGGLSMNSNSKCNTASANGLETFYTDSVTPNVSNLYSIPGTFSSGIRSMMTGSDETKLCVSKYGVQDSIGNVTEFSSDRMFCDSFLCGGIGFGDTGYIGHGDSDYRPVSGNNGNFLNYIFNSESGPCVETGGEGTGCDGYLGTWIISAKINDASRFFIPMGLPGVATVPVAVSGDYAFNFFEQIGISSGITSTQLHNDTIIANQAQIDKTSNTANDIGALEFGLGSVMTGGSYLHSNGAGTYHMEQIPFYDATQNSRVDVGFRCVAPAASAAYIE